MISGRRSRGASAGLATVSGLEKFINNYAARLSNVKLALKFERFSTALARLSFYGSCP